MLTNASGTAVQRYDYDPYGATTQTSSSYTNPYQYTGREKDSNGLYYYRARYYHSGMGRFVSEDPIGLISGMNSYNYVKGNPVGYVDPLGLRNWHKTFVSIGNTANAGKLYAQGSLRIAAGLGLVETGIAAPPGAFTVSLGTWNILSAEKAWYRAQQQWAEAACEDSSNYSTADVLKTYSGLLPWGTESDDPNEPYWTNVAGSHIKDIATKPWHFFQEIGTIGF